MSWDEQLKEWDKILDKMILSFQLMKDEDMDFEHHDTKYWKAHHKKVKEGLGLFAKYFRGLWD